MKKISAGLDSPQNGGGSRPKMISWSACIKQSHKVDQILHQSPLLQRNTKNKHEGSIALDCRFLLMKVFTQLWSESLQISSRALANNKASCPNLVTAVPWPDSFGNMCIFFNNLRKHTNGFRHDGTPLSMTSGAIKWSSSISLKWHSTWTAAYCSSESHSWRDLVLLPCLRIQAKQPSTDGLQHTSDQGKYFDMQNKSWHKLP